MKKQRITLTCITPDDMPYEWAFNCFVFGIWAVHRPNPNGDPNYWHVSHIPTSAVAFVSERFTEAIRAARRLAAVDPPAVSVEVQSDGRLRLKNPSWGWNQRALEMVSDLEVWVTRGGYLVRPYDVLQREAP